MTDFDRRTILAIGALLAALPLPAFAASNPPVVLFICEFGTAKSAIARELFRKRAKERGIDVTAFSRGLQIEDHVSPPLKAKLDAEGIDTRRDGFAVLASKDVRAADMVITFATLPAAYQPRELLDWTALPSVNDAWPAARADLDKRIDRLLDTIAARGGKRR
jgi:protein-tyrosine-phosphatase